MESLYLLIPLSLLIVLAIGGLLAWSVLGGQFDELDSEGRRILDDDHREAQVSARVKSDATPTVRNAHREQGPGAG
jgi:cbb3-type cytochrome oxidase maturation protein